MIEYDIDGRTGPSNLYFVFIYICIYICIFGVQPSYVNAMSSDCRANEVIDFALTDGQGHNSGQLFYKSELELSGSCFCKEREACIFLGEHLEMPVVSCSRGCRDPLQTCMAQSMLFARLFFVKQTQSTDILVVCAAACRVHLARCQSLSSVCGSEPNRSARRELFPSRASLRRPASPVNCFENCVFACACMGSYIYIHVLFVYLYLSAPRIPPAPIGKTE